MCFQVFFLISALTCLLFTFLLTLCSFTVWSTDWYFFLDLMATTSLYLFSCVHERIVVFLAWCIHRRLLVLTDIGKDRLLVNTVALVVNVDVSPEQYICRLFLISQTHFIGIFIHYFNYYYAFFHITCVFYSDWGIYISNLELLM